MNGNSKIWASVAGVSVTAAVVIGVALGTSGGGGHHAPSQRPADQPARIAAAVSTSVAAARPPATSHPAASPSKRKTVKHRHDKARHATVVTNQEPNVTDPTPTATPPADPPQDQTTQAAPPPGGGYPRGVPGTVVNDPYSSSAPAPSPKE